MALEFKIYSNNELLRAVRSMIENDRVSHAYLLYGDRGLGKKTAAKYMAASILCQDRKKAPCGECRNCKRILNGTHPDVITLSPSGKSGNFKAEDDLRPICSDAYVAPNDGDRKIYIIPDFDKTLPLAQNILLKVVEEPPEQTVFIFTASSKSGIIPTIRSRVMPFAVSNVSEDECRQALFEKGFEQSQINEAAEAFAHNIGRCVEYIESQALRESVIAAKKTADAVVSGDEYAILRELTALGQDRAQIKTALELFGEILCDAAVLKSGAGCFFSCGKESAKKLAGAFSLSKLSKIYSAVCECASRIDSNAFAPLALTSLCAQIKSEV